MNVQNDKKNNSNDDAKKIANILFPDVKESTEFYEKKYPQRSLPDNAIVTRFAPSPTGFLHVGGLFSALVSERYAHQSPMGIFYVRIEDTDKKREIENGIEGITRALSRFAITINEGVINPTTESGTYGPYKQSARKEIYTSFIKELIAKGYAYPCFCTPEELEASRKQQELQKIKPGYYGSWAVHRNSTVEDIQKNISSKKPFVIRLKTDGNDQNKVLYKDLIKGEVTVSENDQDVVLLKSDGLPTYHFAHVVDDHLMRTTHVLRGDEWLSSLPIHIQLFNLFDWKTPQYGHISPILKLDGGTKRKLSKRKDPEASVNYYLEQGYPTVAVIEYLLNIANSDFEDWRKNNPTKSYTEFEIKLEKFNKSGALFDAKKLDDISKEVIVHMSAEEVFNAVHAWAEIYDTEWAHRLSQQAEYMKKILSIERTGDKPRKDWSKWSEIKDHTFYFFNDLFEQYHTKDRGSFPESLEKSEIQKILVSYSEYYDPSGTKDQWFDALKTFAESFGFARDMKAYKQNPSGFKGHVGDIAMVVRVALTKKNRTPDLYEIMQILGVKEIKRRLLAVAQSIV